MVSRGLLVFPLTRCVVTDILYFTRALIERNILFSTGAMDSGAFFHWVLRDCSVYCVLSTHACRLTSTPYLNPKYIIPRAGSLMSKEFTLKIKFKKNRLHS